ncbi:succinate dehydrogenase [bacterium]|nr:succinate dehydrogenase [bacterium]
MATGSVENNSSWLKKLNLTWVTRLFTSSIGRKMVMGATGLGLCGFLVVHLAGNLFLYKGREAYDGYAHALHEQEWLPLAEAGLFALFLLHIYLAFVTTWENRRARSKSYVMRESKRQDRVIAAPVGSPSNWMFVSGAVVLGFLILHIIDMKLQLRPDVQHYAEHESFANAIAVLSNPVSQVVYCLGTVFLGFHLSHGFSSAFQSLGLNHPKYTPTIKVVGLIFAVVVAAGFFLLPIIVPMSPGLVEQAKQVEVSIDEAPAATAHP